MLLLLCGIWERVSFCIQFLELGEIFHTVWDGGQGIVKETYLRKFLQGPKTGGNTVKTVQAEVENMQVLEKVQLFWQIFGGELVVAYIQVEKVLKCTYCLGQLLELITVQVQPAQFLELLDAAWNLF